MGEGISECEKILTPQSDSKFCLIYNVKLMDFHTYEAICKVHAVQYILTNLSPTNLNHHHFEYPKYIDTDCMLSFNKITIIIL